MNYFRFEEVESILVPGHAGSAIDGVVVGGIVVVGGVVIGP